MTKDIKEWTSQSAKQIQILVKDKEMEKEGRKITSGGSNGPTEKNEAEINLWIKENKLNVLVKK